MHLQTYPHHNSTQMFITTSSFMFTYQIHTPRSVHTFFYCSLGLLYRPVVVQIEAATLKMVEASKALVEAVRTQSQARALCEERLDSTLRTHEHIVEQSEMISEFRTKITAQVRVSLCAHVLVCSACQTTMTRCRATECKSPVVFIYYSQSQCNLILILKHDLQSSPLPDELACSSMR